MNIFRRVTAVERQEPPIQRDDVIWCYRKILGREPESEGAIRAHLRAPSMTELMKSMVDSEEFQGNVFRGMPPNLDLPPITVEVSGSKEHMEQLRARTSREWERLGQDAPFHSVLTDKRFLPKQFKENESEFWNSGKVDVGNIRAAVARNYPGFSYGGTCVELGCGVGRVTMELARTFDKVLALDISEPHLEIARLRARELGIRNVEFVNIGRANVPDIENCSLFYSRIVLQHNPPPTMLWILRSMVNMVIPAGIAMFQLPVYMRGYKFDLIEYLKTPSSGMEMHCLPQRHIFSLLEGAEYDVCEVREANDIGRPGDWISNTFFAVRRSKEG